MNLQPRGTVLPLGATKNSPSVARLALGGLGSNSGIPTGSPSPTLLATEIPGLFPKGLRRARQFAQDTARIHFGI